MPALYFDYVGDAGHLIVYGHFADGSEGDLTYSSLTKYTSGSETIVKIDKNGRATATGAGHTSITIENNGAKVVVPVSVPNQAPPAESKGQTSRLSEPADKDRTI